MTLQRYEDDWNSCSPVSNGSWVAYEDVMELLKTIANDIADLDSNTGGNYNKGIQEAVELVDQYLIEEKENA